MKRYRFHRMLWSVLRVLVMPLLRHKFNYTFEKYTGDGPCLVLANHNTDWDPLLLGCAFPKHLYFVASEHIFRWGFKTKLLRFFLDPIARQKGTTAGDTALTVLRRIKKGASVALFAEGNRSFNGVTGDIFPATAKLARASGATLVTYRFEGGYLSSPRWCGSATRRGKLTGKIAGVYTHEQLKAMRPEEIAGIIERDLHVDAYETQRREMVPFTGKNLAEHLETVLCLCPKCGMLDSLRSAGDTLSCSCGFQVKYNEYGFFEGADAPYDNVTDWDKAQTEQLLSALPGEGLVYADENMTLTEIGADHSSMVLGTGRMELYTDRLELCGRVFPLDKLGGIALHGAQTVDFSCSEHTYEISSPSVRCTRKYLLAIPRLLHSKEAI